MDNPFDLIHFEIKRSVAHIALNRPPQNLLSIALLEEILQALEIAAEDRKIRALLLTSKLRNVFCTGFELKDHQAGQVFQLIDGFHNVIRTIHQMGVPSISVVSGPALGAGCSLATFCDFVYSTDNGRFGYPEVRYGLMPAVPAAFFPALIGYRATADLLITGRVLEALEAARIGLISQVLSDQEIRPSLEQLLARLSRFSAPILRITLQSMRLSLGSDFLSALQQNQARYLDNLMELQDVREGIAALQENREPDWKHR